MRRVIKGRTYNIDTADEVHVGELAGNEARDWWGLYRKRNGEFFKVTFSADGRVVRHVEPLVDIAARRLLREYAPGLVGRHFSANGKLGRVEKTITIRISGQLAAQLAALASAHGLSLNAYTAKCLARCTAR